MKPNIALSDEQRTEVVKLLHILLADEYVLYTKTRNYHWNVVGPQFTQLHTFFETQYNALNLVVDEVAERVRALGSFSHGTLSEFARHTRLQEEPGQYPSAPEMLRRLLTDHETIIRNVRCDAERCVDQYHDAGTSDFLVGLMEQHEKQAWMLRSLVSGE
jgi:starvation-inducible DNA-binding protein